MKKGIWLGFFFFVALVLLGFGTLIVGNIDMFKEPHIYRVHFATVEGLKTGDDIRVEGVGYGKVSDISLDPRGGVMVTLDLSGPIEIYEGYQIYVEAFTVLGGNYISITRGNLKGRKLDTTQVLHGLARPSALSEVGQIAQDNRETIHELLTNLKDVTAAIKDGKGTVGKFINDDGLHQDLQDFVKEGKESLTEVTSSMKKLLDGSGEGPVKELLHNKEMADKLIESVDSMKEVAASLKRISASVEKGEGLAGAVMKDKEMENRFKRTMENIESVTEKMKDLTSNVENSTVGKLLQEDTIYRKAEKSLDDVGELLGTAARSQLYLETENRTYFESDLSVSRIGLRIEPNESKYFWASAVFLGLKEKGDLIAYEDQADGDDQTIIVPDAGIAYRIPWFLDNRLTLKGGLLEGKPGGALEFNWEEWGLFDHPILFVLEARDAYNSVADEDIHENLNGPMIRAWAKTALWGKEPDLWWEDILHATKLYAGASRIGDDHMEFFAGLGLEWKDKDIRSLISLVGMAN